MFPSNWRPFVLIAGETCLLVAAVAGASYVRLGSDTWRLLQNENGLWKALLIVGICQLSLYYADLYDLRGVTSVSDLTPRLIEALGATSLILAAIYFLAPDWIVGRGVFLISVVFMVTLVVAWRMAFAWLTQRVAPRERLLLVGTSAAAVELARELFERRQELGVEIVGFVDPDPMRIGMAVLNPGVVGAIDDIPLLVSKLNVDRVVVSLADARGKLPMDKLLEMKLDGVSFDHLTSVYEEYTGKIAVENLRPSWLIFSPGFRKTRRLLLVKRLFDIVGAGIGLILTAPIVFLLAIVVKLTSPGPAFYSQRRVGRDGRVFVVRKLRSMCANAERDTGPVWTKSTGDARITRVGRFLRRTRLDELPQFWNILAGHMSLVGPRPERPEFVESLMVQIPFYGQRHVVKPGLTGWAQVRYTYGATVEDAVEKLQYDLFYIKNMSIALDLFIAFETVKTVLLRRGQ
jgi:sugar transferase (PEP-CTERM system associated)